ncbi:MAG: hypothetical protein FJZ00_04780 [Candidatus Sericytochromatia bacterium]|uniref:Uncharacterized protein n=1 Tax=Candidatus Tanganyikabacteria bacterium TaxID=2961651 RepID=A0A938BIK9_9BACT|nr:hypothetical protein [Candidatus Tanganyikabacteria bacterium]
MPPHVSQGTGLGPVKSPRTASEAVMQVIRKALEFPECKNTLDCKRPLCVPPCGPATSDMPPGSFDELFEAAPKLAFLGWGGFLRAHAEAEDPLTAMLRPRIRIVAPLSRPRPKRTSLPERAREPRLVVAWAPPAWSAPSGARPVPAPGGPDLRSAAPAERPDRRNVTTDPSEASRMGPEALPRVAAFAHPAPWPAEPDFVPAAHERRSLSGESPAKIQAASIRPTEPSARLPGPDPLTLALNVPRFNPPPPPQGGHAGAQGRPGQADPDQARRSRLIQLLRQLLLSLSLGPRTARELRKALFALMTPGSKVPSDDAVRAWLGRLWQD